MKPPSLDFAGVATKCGPQQVEKGPLKGSKGCEQGSFQGSLKGSVYTGCFEGSSKGSIISIRFRDIFS